MATTSWPRTGPPRAAAGSTAVSTPAGPTRPRGAPRDMSRIRPRGNGGGRGRPTGASSTTAPQPTRTAGGMSRSLPSLAELQPALTVEVSPELATERGLTHLGWAHVVTSRTAIEARVVVTDRMAPLRVQGRTVHQIWLPYHWGSVGL